jgi:hypothetical protein
MLIRSFDEKCGKLPVYTSPSDIHSARALLQEIKSELKEFIDVVLRERRDDVHPEDDGMMAE